ncbi:hypothetical protein DOTSEDRAFT_78938 [Dothistroma septosporum NZE10]|uniref:Protein kinase domain-containing protein n=1 Tax=Dothistroma septosporum (strain NZE10 / CBS 128990) TaxID=675120 RepID=N1PTT1_DOTSN|nr:hypothetical protein DOTSEDRAFT_78938 [Dothistroma septosporum NZE10]
MEAADSAVKPECYELRLVKKRLLFLTDDHSDLGTDPPMQCRCDPETHNTRWPGVPFAKLADFDIGILQGNDNADIPGTLTPGFDAPEQYDYSKAVRPRPDLDGTGVSHKSNIWSVGKTMMNLINLQYEGDPDYVDGKYDESWRPNRLNIQNALDLYEAYAGWPLLRWF